MSEFWKKIRKDFSLDRQSVYLDHAAGAPMPRPVKEAIQTYTRELERGADFFWMDWVKRREEVRQKTARFIHADPDEVTFVSSTSEGMNYIAELIAREGQILTNREEFPSSTVPWLWRKADLVWQRAEEGKVSIAKMRALLSPKIKTILTSYVQYASGYRQDLTQVGRIKDGRFLVVNATQAMGALPIDVRKWKADFLVSNSYKWMLAGYGGGILYIRKKWLQKFKPYTVGWRSMRDPERMDNRLLDLNPKAMRYELGCPNFPAIFAFGGAVEYFSGIGVERIEKRILELSGYFIREAEKAGFRVLSPKEPEHRSGIVLIEVRHPGRVWKELLSKKIYTSPRGQGLRVAPHFYNQTEEIDKLIKHLKQIRDKQSKGDLCRR